MRARIRQHPQYERIWIIEYKRWWWWPWWDTEDSCIGDDAEARALKTAEALINPIIIEVRKERQGEPNGY